MGTEQTLEERVAAALRDAGVLVAVAESSTGGLLSSMLTDVPGSSAYFERGVVTYSNDAKVDLLGVDRATLDEHGAVSAPTACQMARGVRALAGTTWGVSTTGVAGPGGGTSRTPVGTVYIGAARADDGDTDGGTETASECSSTAATVSVERYEFEGTRRDCKEQFARQALSDLRSAVSTSE
jgi:nicotinamide-nucleotide amidase